MYLMLIKKGILDLFMPQTIFLPSIKKNPKDLEIKKEGAKMINFFVSSLKLLCQSYAVAYALGPCSTIMALRAMCLA